MLKSTFSKYLITFVIITLISFIILSGIITSMIRGYFFEEREDRVVNASRTLSTAIERFEQTDIDAPGFLDPFVFDMITPLINNDTGINILVLDENGKVVLSSIGVAVGENGFREPAINSGDEFGSVDIELFADTAYKDSTVRIHRGNLGGYFSEASVACLDDVFVNGKTSGYIIASYSTVKEDNFIITARQAILSSSAWVMIAAVIAVYFITQRIVSPLENMKVAVKRFGKGDFSARVTVQGSDEVSELGVAFNNMADSLEKLEKMRSSFLASVSHDLRTPMTTIAGFIDGIMSGAIPQEKHEYYLGIISDEVHRLSRLVSQLLDVSRLESGDRKMNFESFDAAEIARVVLISFEQKIDDKMLEVEFYSECDEMVAYADKDAIHQVLYNLCHNAIKFANEGGKFRVKLNNIDQRRMIISVFDQGQVISDEDKKFVFERFYKTDSSRGLDKNGVGLGLYICKTIIDAHDEEIGVRSAEDGTEFYFTLKRMK